MAELTKKDLLFDGKILMLRWCTDNLVPPPRIDIHEGFCEFEVCAFYRDSVIHIWPKACAGPGYGGMAWSWPGYSVDRTPYGVIQHELGHHVDRAHGARAGIYSRRLRKETQDEPITKYCENDNEWFAEIFRLFVTNPSLLAAIRPRIYSHLIAMWPSNVESRPWQEVLAGSARHLRAAEVKIATVSKARAKQQSLL